MTYIVKNGDTLSEIIEDNIITSETRIYGKDGLLKKVIKLNNLKRSGNLILAGLQIKLPTTHLETKTVMDSRIPSNNIDFVDRKESEKEKEKFSLGASYGPSYFSLSGNGVLGTTNIAGMSLLNSDISFAMDTKSYGYYFDLDLKQISFTLGSVKEDISLVSFSTSTRYKQLFGGVSMRELVLLKLNPDLSITSLKTKTFFVKLGYIKEIFLESSILDFSLFAQYGVKSSSSDPLISFSSLSSYGLKAYLNYSKKFLSNWKFKLSNSFEYLEWSSNIVWDDRDGKASSSFIDLGVSANLIYIF